VCVATDVALVQRARRFRSAKDAREAVEKAIKEGKEIPKEPAFDSNTITPGTDFMDRLSEHLKWFIRKKIAEDSAWRKVDVIFSGQECPGEGEHKVSTRDAILLVLLICFLFRLCSTFERSRPRPALTPT
jgi:hypothetical protein